MPSLTQLEYIVAVDRYRHFGKAAQRCNVTQPTLSMQIQKVEEEIGYPLFDRLKKPVVPTAKGQRFLTQAKVLLHEHTKLLDLSKHQEHELSGELRLGVIPTIAPYLLPLFLESFSKLHPKLQLYVDELKTGTILEMIKEDRLDAGILATPLGEAGLHEQTLFYEPFYLYLSPGHPLAARKKIREDDLESEQMWLLQDGHCFRNQIVRYCSLKNHDGVFPNVRFEGGNIDTLRYLIRKSKSYTLVPALFVETLSPSERRDLVREFDSPVPTREVSLVYRRDQWKWDILKTLETSVLKALPPALKSHNPKKQEVLDVR